jgi:Dolichyl-phosphate-mannose-protein mannosyltransferase
MEVMRNGRWRYWGPLAIVLVVAFALRLWGIKQGLPFLYNVDEYGHFVPEAVAMFHHGLNPHYFINPPALTYLLHVIFAIWLGVRSGSHPSITHEFALHPDHLFLVARITVALLGTFSVWLLYLLGARLFNRTAGLLASALMAVSFLPVFYAHLALNDVPTLAPLTLSLLGAAGILRRGRMFDYLLAGFGLGLAGATKYTAGVMILPLLAAAVARYLDGRSGAEGSQGVKGSQGVDGNLTQAEGRSRVEGSPAQAGGRPGVERSPEVEGSTAQAGGRSGAGRDVAVGLLIALVAALIAFLVANPYSLLDFHLFLSELKRQSNYTEMSRASWIGAPRQSGIIYYLWSFTWGLGWIPALAALGGAVTIWRRRQIGWMLVPVTVLYIIFLSLQGRYFGRWLLPILPIACLLAANFALDLAGWAARRAPRLRLGFTALAVVALAGQGIVYSIHSGLVLSHSDTRNLARAWVVAHIRAHARIVVEPVVPNAWLDETGALTDESPPARVRWAKYPTLRILLNPSSGMPEPTHRTVLLENYESTLGPALIPYYERNDYCWIVSGFTQSGRAFADPKIVPNAIAYYRELERQGEVVYHVSPYSSGKSSPGKSGPGNSRVAFNFDWTFDYYPLVFHRPGPEMTIYRLHGGRCA